MMPRRPEPRLSPGRLTAGRALLDAERGGHLDEALEAGGVEERPLANHLAYGVCRRRGVVDLALAAVSDRPLQRLDAPVLVALRVGAFERLFSRTPDHAAVGEAVELCRALGAPHASGFVNALLRRVSAPVEELPLWVNHPAWWAARWRARIGDEALGAWCLRESEPPPIGVIAKDGDTAAFAALLTAEGLTVRPALAGGLEVPGALWINPPFGKVESLPGFAEGKFWVMDPAAAAIADLVGAAPGQRVLDACAAPGGKTLRLLASGAEVLATDKKVNRLARMAESLGRVGLSAESRRVDWQAADPGVTETFDAALVDAPCTGLGTMRRHPEVRWSRGAGDPAAMSLHQRVILKNVAARVKPGGALVYAVCSPEPEEGDGVVRAFVERHPEFSVETTLSTAPPERGEDGFFGARLRRSTAT
jgi:16S rRNA (cytosine967-C5)-methyltransferase